MRAGDHVGEDVDRAARVGPEVVPLVQAVAVGQPAGRRVVVVLDVDQAELDVGVALELGTDQRPYQGQVQPASEAAWTPTKPPPSSM